MAKKKTKRVVDPEGKRQAILDATLNEMVDKGYHGTKSADISTKAKVGAGTVFKIFGNKSKLANEVFRRSYDRYNSFMVYVYDFEDPKQQFDQIWNIFMSMIKNYPQDFIFYELHFHKDYIDKKSDKSRSELKDIMNRWLKWWKERDVLKELPPIVMQSLILGALSRIVREEYDGNCKVTKKMLLQIRDACWDAIKK